MRLLLLILLLALATSGCESERRLTDAQIATTFLNGISTQQVTSLHFRLRGNHAGLTGVARLWAPKEIAQKIVAGSIDFGFKSPTEVEEGMTEAQMLFQGSVPEWYLLDPKQPIRSYRRRANRECVYYYIEPVSGTLYVHYSRT